MDGVDRRRTRLGLALRHVADKVLLEGLLQGLAAKATRVAETDHELPPVPTA
ncbi:hypothetical protein [Curtobacterium oceanosedimentum]|uniref:hypothetical protein n=1 Tax=Curtobacterium oceanosedimentum TaxID=465820 RepID=UPI003392B4DB